MKYAFVWLDDVRPYPFVKFDIWDAFCHCHSVDEAKQFVKIFLSEPANRAIYFDLDHDLGDYAIAGGGDAINFVNWLVENYHDKDMNFKFHFHSMNPVGVQNMKNAVEKYWEII